jgi:hypothetical protein
MLNIVEFKTQYRATKDPVDWVLISPIGPDLDKTQTWHRVDKIRPPENVDDNVRDSLSYQDMAAKWSVIGPAYEAWKSGNELPETGTPLDAWSGVTRDQAKFMKDMGVRTVEDVRDMSDATMEKLRIPNARALPGLAKKYLEGESAAVKDAKIAEMAEQMRVMQEMLEEQAKPKRGRPAKKENEAA